VHVEAEVEVIVLLDSNDWLRKLANWLMLPGLNSLTLHSIVEFLRL